MINFFRKIRKQLADENKPLKYMRHAIGEIVLVVIGILIALQVNNWNIDKTDKKSETKYLNNIKLDLQKDLASLTEFQSPEYRNGVVITNMITKDLIPLYESIETKSKRLINIIELELKK